MRLTAIVLTSGLLAMVATAPTSAHALGGDRRDIRQDPREIRHDRRDGFSL